MKEKETAQIGDFKRKIRFAIFPVRINGELIWFKRYVKVFRYEEVIVAEEVEVSSGLFEDVVTSVGLFNTRTKTIYHKIQTWVFYDKELILK